ncbi:high affinity cationic amino acid transporter 1-like [Actinia tenebrosa]|uniref:High affinity cationic amino acid transporter 1-like n=1 Tax=Actinia tenebrosa TaxID=6105 RepID=A0A6P8HTD3_ACTTE|nr:high affinity cationic amino acid transporter 1-like [Actinia tenebrosa]XP_031558494.1 high affinity cationic amino acid transporter 1-like [Actinia tenebrosa]
MSSCRNFALSLLRRRETLQIEGESLLRRCLNTFDLTALGVGTVIGAGLYVVTGELARDVAGPAVVISFFIAAAAAFLSGLCYAEFSSRIPKAGSAYIYTYVALGELFAFIVGWNMILEYLIAAASLARSCSEYINSIAGGEIYKFFINDIASWKDITFLGPFPDFLAMAIGVIITVIVCLGVQHSAIFNKITTVINILVICFVIIAGLFYVESNNWSSPKKFAPYGVSGILTAAGSCFYAFVGFDAIATAGEEAINPKRSLPLSIMFCLIISFLAYFGVATVLTLILPYHRLSRFAPLAEAFATRGFPAARYVISIGAICATSSCLMCNSFAAPRVVYSMASDGLLFSFFAKVNQRTFVPVRATVLDGLIVCTLAVIMDIRQLVEMLSIGTLVAYSMVALSVLLTRYQPGVPSVTIEGDVYQENTRKWLKKLCCKKEDKEGDYEVLSNEDEKVQQDTDFMTSSDMEKAEPSPESCCRASFAAASLVLGITGLCLTLTLAYPHLAKKEVWAILLACFFGLVILMSLMVLERQPKNDATFPFMVPGCPYLPTISIFINVLLVVKLKYWTYVRFGIWMVLGFFIYFFYGYRHSNEALSSHDEVHQYILPDTPPIKQRVEVLQPDKLKRTHRE